MQQLHKKGFVFGKFMPLHKGHQAMIEYAATQCQTLTVLVCCSHQEQMPADLRLQWIQETYSQHPNIEPQLLLYDESELPNSSESDRGISALWAAYFQRLLPEATLLVSSEPYGEYVAEYMGIEHRPFDPPRLQVPISASRIRQQPWLYWDFLPDAVKPYYHRKLVLLGTESTGKTTLAAQLAAHFGMPWVSEAGRDLIPDSTDFSIDDLYAVAEEQARRVSAALQPLPPLLILDTDIHITQSYAHYSFGQYLDVAPFIYQIQQADLYIYLQNDVPYVQDGGRLPKAERDALDASHRATLAHFKIAFEEIGGDWEARWQAVLEKILQV